MKGKKKMKCKICDIEIINPASDICGHPTCIIKKAERIFERRKDWKNR